MDIKIYKQFIKLKTKFKNLTEGLSITYPNLKVIYNNALEDITQESEIKLILVGDNPGRREAETGRYLVGPSGKIAARFFRENPELGIDFYKNVIILNKTPIHTNRTIELKALCKKEGAPALEALEYSQKKMAALLLEFHKLFNVPVYITGYSEMNKHGVFKTYTEEIKRIYEKQPQLYKQLFFFRHFSMNRFTIDLKNRTLEDESTAKALKRIGTLYRQKILTNI